jgi:hypothetical protein
VRSYFVALHEIAHCVLGYDKDQPAAPQEAAAWRWAVEQAIEPPSEGVQRMMFRVLWHYLVGDLARDRRTVSSASARLFPARGDSFWIFLSSLDESSRLLYEATKLLAHVGPIAQARDEVEQEIEEQRVSARQVARLVRVRNELRRYGPPRRARREEAVLLGSGRKAHIWETDGMFGSLAGPGEILCGSSGVAHPAPPESLPCKHCASVRMSREVAK